MGKYYIGGVATVSAFSNGQHLFTAKTLTDSSINISVSNEEIRGGEGAQLLGKFFHTTVFNLSLTDALFDFEYIMKQTGSQEETTKNTVGWKNAKQNAEKTLITKVESNVTFTVESGDTLANVNFDGLYSAGNIAWCEQLEGKTLPLTNGGTTGTYTFNAGSSDNADKFVNGEYCITYPVSINGERQIKVSAMYYPAEFSLIMRAKLFAGDACKVSDGQAAGEVVIEIPRFQLDGTIDLAMAMTSPATYSLNGSALANGCGCGENPWYAKITQVIANADPYAGYTDIVVDDDTLVNGSTIGVYAFASGKMPKAISLDYVNIVNNIGTPINPTAPDKGKVTIPDNGNTDSKTTITISGITYGKGNTPSSINNESCIVTITNGARVTPTEG